MRKRQSALDNRLMQTTLAASGSLDDGGPLRELPFGALATTNFAGIQRCGPGDVSGNQGGIRPSPGRIMAADLSCCTAKFV